LGTVTTGTWNATIIGTAYGGTGLGGSTPYTSGGAVYASSASVLTSGVLPVSGGGTNNANLTFPAGTVSIGYLNIPQNAQTSTYTLVLTDSGKQIYMAAAQAATTYTIPANSSVAFSIGTVVQFLNMSVNNMTISINTDTLTWSNGGSAGSRTLSQYGVANCVKITSTQWLITGVNLT
jgi:hypothetical protein